MIQAKHRNRMPLPQPAVVHVRRSYSECRYGQMHVWTAYPSGGGFDERTPVICLHHSGGSGRLYPKTYDEMFQMMVDDDWDGLELLKPKAETCGGCSGRGYRLDEIVQYREELRKKCQEDSATSTGKGT